MTNIENTEKFKSIILDFVNDLSNTFPEYSVLWENLKNANDQEYQDLFKYCTSVYPERFFDILYQNNDIFNVDSEFNTHFLPNVDFKLLFNCENISENTKQTMWKYLQLVLITIVNNVNDKSIFGETADLFQGVDENLLQEKLAETIGGLSDFFKNTKDSGVDSDGNPEESAEYDGESDSTPNFSPEFENMGNIHEHLKTLFDGKIGKMAKDIAEDFSEDIMNMFKGQEDITDTKDIFKKLMHNPKKLMDLFKSIGSKINEKMSSGDISKEEVMKEASEIMGKMKGMGDMGKFEDIIKNMANMGGFGKNAKYNANAFNQMKSTFGNRERLKSKLEKRNEAKLQAQKFVLEKKEVDKEYVFSLPDEGIQEKSSAPNATKSASNSAIDNEWVNDSIVNVKLKTDSTKPKKKKNKNKK